VQFAITDYLIYGVVSGSAGNYTVTLNLEAAKSREVVKSGSIAYSINDDPIATGQLLAAMIAPYYQTILDFEKKKRDEGDPYAINPKIVITPEKEKLNTKESCKLTFNLKDCDGVGLKDRQIQIEISSGKLDNYNVKTDGDGNATATFTGGSVPEVVQISAAYPFQHATGYMDAAENTPVNIQVAKPDNKWYVHGSFNNDYSVTTNIVSPTRTADFDEKSVTTVEFGGFIDNINPISGSFTNNSLTDVIKCKATYFDRNTWQSHDELDCSYIDDHGAGQCIATSTANPHSDLALGIYANSYHFGLGAITSTQSGGGNSVRETSDCWFGARSNPESSKF
jgi:hypothetical protein